MFIIKKLASFYLFLTLSFLLLAAMTAGTFIPQNQTAEEIAAMFRPETLSALKALGLLNLYHSPWFIALLGLLGLNTAACIAMRLAERRFKKLPWGALVSHAGFLVILLGGMISGIRAEKGVLALRVGDSQCCVPTAAQDKTLHLPFQIKLTQFNVDYYDGGRHFLEVTDKKEGWKENLEVKVGDKYILKEKVRIEVLRHVPDFRLGKDEKTGKPVLYSASNHPNNPALQVSVTASPERKVWLFAHFPGFSHEGQEPLDLQYHYQPAKVRQFESS